jgi:hypothetical protein
MKDQFGKYCQVGLFGRWFDQDQPYNELATQTPLKK